MTAATTPSRASARSPLAAPPHRKSAVGFADLAALTLRQHRVALILVTALYVLFGLVIKFANGRLEVGRFVYVDPQLFSPVLAIVVGLFLGAPLLASEYEQRTYVVAWSQDVSPLRWLRVKLIVLGGAVVLLSGLFALFVRAQAVHEYVTHLGPYQPTEVSAAIAYQSWLPLTIAWAVTGFVFGVVIGATARRIVAAMSGTLFGLGGLWFLMNYVVRPWLMTSVITPVRDSWPLANLITHPEGQPAFMFTQDYVISWQLWVTSSGSATEGLPSACYDTYYGQQIDMKSFVACMARQGYVSGAEDYQPADRTIVFQSIELAMYAVLIALCIGLTVWSVRRYRHRQAN
ncbi:MAG TPA: hypothetical protein VGN81_05030 [Pseudonocardiaceae bacterium]|jgi:hypothetical protein